MEHLADDDLILLYFGMVEPGPESERVECHLLWCESCIDRAERLWVAIQNSRD